MKIEDKIIEPYLIDVGDTYTLMKKVKIKNKKTGKIKDGTLFIGDFTSFESVLKRIIQLKISEIDNVFTLKTYIELWDKNVRKFDKLLKIIDCHE